MSSEETNAVVPRTDNLFSYLRKNFSQEKDLQLNKFAVDLVGLSALGMVTGGVISIFFFKRKAPVIYYLGGLGGGFAVGKSNLFNSSNLAQFYKDTPCSWVREHRPAQ
eukprot:TRINITY_DN5521_c0_g1_i2.p1 TRINITY_DN5521_c0_g1~~TRINITY_DN5521_c0_g1_i2.p1  ORF type:complete len:108 (+),score=21.71 TRINITY_DN5521_c0_g1_i2:52-375(+)